MGNGPLTETENKQNNFYFHEKTPFSLNRHFADEKKQCTPKFIVPAYLKVVGTIVDAV